MPRTRKLSPKRLGPFKVLEKIGIMNYRLELPRSMKIHPVFHVSLLTRHMEDQIPGRVQTPPEPVEIDRENEYEVESILDSRLRRGKLQYLVKWKGYSVSENTWEPEDMLGNSPGKIRAFHRKYPSAPRRIPATAGLEFRPLCVLTTDPCMDGTLDLPTERTLFRSALRGG
jgi:hypothetical protein